MKHDTQPGKNKRNTLTHCCDVPWQLSEGLNYEQLHGRACVATDLAHSEFVTCSASNIHSGFWYRHFPWHDNETFWLLWLLRSQVEGSSDMFRIWPHWKQNLRSKPLFSQSLYTCCFGSHFKKYCTLMIFDDLWCTEGVLSKLLHEIWQLGLHLETWRVPGGRSKGFKR